MYAVMDAITFLTYLDALLHGASVVFLLAAAFCSDLEHRETWGWLGAACGFMAVTFHEHPHLFGILS